MNKRIVCAFLAFILIVGSLSTGMTVHAASALSASEDCITLLKAMEGFIEKPVWDYSQYSVGYGSYVPEEDLGLYEEGINEEEADILMRMYVSEMGKAINTFADNYGLTLTQNQFDALTIFSYNCGTGWLSRTGTLRTAIIEGKTGSEFINAIAQWCSAGKKIQTGLIRRRLCEANVYFNGIYDTTVPGNYNYVLFSAQGGSCSTVVRAFLSEDAPNIALPEATKTDYVFDGWYTAIEGGALVKSLSAALSGSTLYAHWSDGTAEKENNLEVEFVDLSQSVSAENGTDIYESADKTSAVQLHLTNGAVIRVCAKGTDENGIVWGQISSGGWIDLSDTVTYVPVATAAPVKVTVTGDIVNLRSGMGTSYPTAGTATRGTSLTITATGTVNMGGSDTLWGKTESGVWICLKYTTYGTETTEETTGETRDDTDTDAADSTDKEETSTEDSSAKVPETTEEKSNSVITVKVTAGALNVRKGAGTSYQAVSTITRGNTAGITEYQKIGSDYWGKLENGNWICLTYTDFSVPSQTLAEDETTEETKTEDQTAAEESADVEEQETDEQPATEDDTETESNSAAEEKKSVTVTVTGDVLNVRSGAGTSNNKTGTVTRGKTVVIVATETVGSSVWGQMENGGWICLSYTDYKTASAAATENDNAEEKTSTDSATGSETTGNSSAQTEAQTGTVTANSLNVRSGAGTGYGTVAGVVKGEQVTILETKTVNGVNWGRISSGWICMNYVTLSSTSTGNSNTASSKYSVTASALNVRSTAGLNSTVTGVVYKGQQVTVTELVSASGYTWGKLSTGGWVCINYLKAA